MCFLDRLLFIDFVCDCYISVHNNKSLSNFSADFGETFCAVTVLTPKAKQKNTLNVGLFSDAVERKCLIVSMITSMPILVTEIQFGV